ncbi:hypothetical protein Tco_0462634 [Tanacetum coccineum]
MQSPLQSPPKISSQPKAEHIKKDKGKKAMSLEKAEKESTNSGSNDDDETYVTGSMVESSTTKKLKKQDFVTIEDQKDFLNTMLYTVQEIFFKRHQGPGLDDHARTFSSLLLVKVDKRNLNPLKQMRVIDPLRQ